MMEKRDLLFVAVESTGSEPYPLHKNIHNHQRNCPKFVTSFPPLYGRHK